MTETSAKYGFFKKLKMKLALIFGIGGAVVHPVVGIATGAGAYGLGAALESKHSNQLEKLNK